MPKKIPQRQCIGCRLVKSKYELVRIVKDDENVEIDLTGKKNGRGAYICKSKGCLEKAFKSKALDRTFKMSVSNIIYSELENAMDSLGVNLDE